jgi:Family of unknown function (DUF6152)
VRLARRKRNLLTLVFSIFGLVAVCSPLLAHHGSAGFGLKEITLKQVTVTRFRWANPHTLILFDVKDDKGNIVHWAGETGSAASLKLLGWTKETLHSGDVITVYIYPHKFNKDFGRIEKIALADGQVLRDSDREDRGDITRY